MPAVISSSLGMIVRHQRKVSQTTAGILMGTNLSSKLLFYRSEGSQWLCSFDLGEALGWCWALEDSFWHSKGPSSGKDRLSAKGLGSGAGFLHSYERVRWRHWHSCLREGFISSVANGFSWFSLLQPLLLCISLSDILGLTQKLLWFGGILIILFSGVSSVKLAWKFYSIFFSPFSLRYSKGKDIEFMRYHECSLMHF